MPNKTGQTNETDVGSGGTDLQVDLWVRRPVCGPRTTVIDRLSSLCASGPVADFSVTTWPEEIALTGSNRQEELLETIEGFEDWAADRGLSLRPPFETRTVSRLVGGSEDVLTTPMLLAAAYRDDDVDGAGVSRRARSRRGASPVGCRRHTDAVDDRAGHELRRSSDWLDIDAHCHPSLVFERLDEGEPEHERRHASVGGRTSRRLTVDRHPPSASVTVPDTSPR